MWAGSCGAIQGAKMAQITKSVTNTNSRWTPGRCGERCAGVRWQSRTERATFVFYTVLWPLEKYVLIV